MMGTKLQAQSLHTPLEEAVEELHRRRADKALCRAVAEFQRTHPPEFLDGEPRAFLVRPVFSADLELDRWMTLSRKAELEPLCLEVSKDRFYSFNREKYRRGKLTFCWPNRSRALRIIDFQCNGRRFDEIPSRNGCSLVEFHHRMLAHAHPQLAHRVRDFSDWLFAASKIPPRYLHLLALAITHGILFENFFLDDPEERRFMEERILPSFHRAVELFGVKPLIVRLFTPEEENTPICWQYPGELYPFARDLLNGGASKNFTMKIVKGMKNPETNRRLRIKSTGRYGRGIFAAADIPKGTVIHVLGGERMTLDEFVKRITRGDERLDDPLQIGKRTYLDLDEFSRLFNHSCDPCAGLRKTSELFALRDIRAGEEITFDYSATIAPTVWEMRCLCGSPKCRKVLGDIRSIPGEQLASYQAAGALQRYMKPLLREIQTGSYKIPAYEQRALEMLEKD